MTSMPMPVTMALRHTRNCQNTNKTVNALLSGVNRMSSWSLQVELTAAAGVVCVITAAAACCTVLYRQAV